MEWKAFDGDDRGQMREAVRASRGLRGYVWYLHAGDLQNQWEFPLEMVEGETAPCDHEKVPINKQGR